ncbi:hypothetical protein HELRODRAFT_162891 [Helobdella robusta]|uniref:Uncharacterized protein n=1 Tax=Helobdella robusta TaxID=6412 RepID=T1ETB8_HELRO|nr:hypothetical protein HELRODRAFT_162891 [Helobdella robusta]ESN99358.1 hypothetical protein HELRODRAFT_162891 [Helobdella robusta]
MEIDAVYSFQVQKLGSETTKSSNSINSLQKPLRKMYTFYQKNFSTNAAQHKIVAGVHGMTIIDTCNQHQNAEETNKATNLQILKNQIIFKAALQFKTIVADKKGKKFKAAFVPLDQGLLAKNKKKYNSLFVNLDEKENFLSTVTDNPPLFVFITKINKIFNMHVFVCSNETQALDIVNAFDGIAPKLNEVQSQNQGNNVSEKKQVGYDDNPANKESTVKLGNLNSQLGNFAENSQLKSDPMILQSPQPHQNPILANNVYDQLHPTQHIPPFNPQMNVNQPTTNYPQVYGQLMPPYYQQYGNPYQPQHMYGPPYIPPNFPVSMQQCYNPSENMYQPFANVGPSGTYTNFYPNQAYTANVPQEKTDVINNNLHEKIQPQHKTANLIPRPVIVNTNNAQCEQIEEKFNDLNIKPAISVTQPTSHFSKTAKQESSQQISQLSPLTAYNPFGNLLQTVPEKLSNHVIVDEIHNLSPKDVNEVQQTTNAQADTFSYAPVTQKRNEKVPPIPPTKKPPANVTISNKSSTSQPIDECTSPVSPETKEKHALKVPKKVMGIQVLPFGLDRQIQKKTSLSQPSSPQELSSDEKTIPTETTETPNIIAEK